MRRHSGARASLASLRSQRKLGCVRVSPESRGRAAPRSRTLSDKAALSRSSPRRRGPRKQVAVQTKPKQVRPKLSQTVGATKVVISASGAAVAEIYSLFSGRDGKVRYIGQTLGTLDVRFKEHQRCQIGRYMSRVYSWLHQEWRAGFPVRCALLERCSASARRDLEREWISRFPNLLNEQNRSYYWHGRKPPVIPEIREYTSQFIFNCGGFRGIHYCRELDRYAVFVYDGRDWRWLPGDGAPGWAGDIWFSDRIDALEARKKFRHARYCTWLPDTSQNY